MDRCLYTFVIVILVILNKSAGTNLYHHDLGCYLPDPTGTRGQVLKREVLVQEGNDHARIAARINHTLCIQNCYDYGFQYTGMFSYEFCPVAGEACSWYLECRCLNSLPTQKEDDDFNFRCPEPCENHPHNADSWCVPKDYTQPRAFLFQGYKYNTLGCFSSSGGFHIFPEEQNYTMKFDSDLNHYFGLIDNHACASACMRKGTAYMIVNAVTTPCQTGSVQACLVLDCSCAGTPPDTHVPDDTACPFTCNVVSSLYGGGNWCLNQDKSTDLHVFQVSLKNPNGNLSPPTLADLTTKATAISAEPTTTTTQLPRVTKEPTKFGGLGVYGLAGLVGGVAFLILIIVILIVIIKINNVKKKKEIKRAENKAKKKAKKETMNKVLSGMKSPPSEADTVKAWEHHGRRALEFQEPRPKSGKRSKRLPRDGANARSNGSASFNNPAYEGDQRNGYHMNANVNAVYAPPNPPPVQYGSPYYG